MRTVVVLTAVALAAARLVAAGAGQASPQSLFEKGLTLEEVQSKPTEAIAVYEQVMRESDDRALAARAQLHIGLCYERLGLEKAREAYEKVIRDYPGEAAAVAVAREKLDHITRASAAARKDAGELTIRNVPIPPAPPIELYGVSPDGKYAAYVDANTGDLGIRELLAGSQRRLTDEGRDYSQYAIFPRWSPDSTRLAYAWNEKQIRVVGLDGAPPRVLVGDSEEEWVWPLDWSPDATQLLMAGTSRKERTVRLRLVMVADGSVRPLKAFGSIRDIGFGPCLFSPDGRAIAYSRAIERGAQERDVFLLSLDGALESPLIQHPADDVLLAWLPGEGGLLFASDRAGTIDLWMAPFERGSSLGAPVLVKRGLGPVTPMGVTRTGAFYYQTPAATTDVYTASLDPATGLVIGPPKKEPLPFEGHNGMPDWSPDGKRLAFVSSRPGERLGVLSVYSADTGKVREFRPEKASVYPKWSRDGRHLYVQATVADGQGIYRMDAQTGEMTPFLAGRDGWYLHDLEGSPDGRWIVYGRDSKTVCQIVRRDAATGEEQELDRTPFDNSTLALSPDGSRLAILMRVDEKTRVVKVMAFPDGTPKEIHRFALAGRWIVDIAWSADGRYIYFSDNPPGVSGEWRLRRISAAGGDAVDLGSVTRYYRQISVHPDGSRITFSSAPAKIEPAQLWVMEHILPTTGAADGKRR